MINAQKWTDEEIQYLRDNFKLKSHEEIANDLNRTRNSVRSRCSRLGIVDISDNWTDKQIEELKKFYSDKKYSYEFNIDVIAKRLGKLKSNICRKARELGLTNKSRDKKEFKKAKVSLAKFSDEERAEFRRLFMANRHKTNGHHMLGKSHTEESKKKMSEKSKNMWGSKTEDEIGEIVYKSIKTRERNGTLQTMNRANASWGAAWREIGGYKKYYRSKWEANYARYLEWLKQKGEILDWKHEPDTFWFEGIKRGCMSYLPDFKVTEKYGAIAYHEVKGWMDDRSKTKIKRMAKYHPTVKLIVIDSKAYASIKKIMQPIIKDWETDSKGR